jgi:hypothetical protein
MKTKIKNLRGLGIGGALIACSCAGTTEPAWSIDQLEIEQRVTAQLARPQAAHPTLLPPAAPFVPAVATHVANAATSCGELEIVPERETLPTAGNVLVLFDRSASMEDDWREQPKQEAAGEALIEALTPFAAQLTIGGVFFPSEEAAEREPSADGFRDFGRCAVNGIDSPDQLAFMPAPEFMESFPYHWHIEHAAGTPLEAGVRRATEAIRDHNLKGPLTVLVVTDGKPNCDTDESRVLNQVTAWRTAGILTHVVGLPGARDAAAFLGELARAGGTQLYDEPNDPHELERALRKMVQPQTREAFRSCSFHVDHAGRVPERLQVYVTRQGVEAAVAHGLTPNLDWTVDAASDDVTLQGELCQQALKGELQGLRFVLGCEPVLAQLPEPMLF